MEKFLFYIRRPMVNIRPAVAIRQNYNEIANLCRQSGEPVFLTKKGEGDLVVMDIDTFNQRERLLRFREDVLDAAEENMAEQTECNMDELQEYISYIFKRAANA